MTSLSAVGASTSGSRSHTVTWMTARIFLLGAIIVALPTVALADPDKPDDKLDHTIIVGVGGAAELELDDGSLHPGANLMVEWDAIESWLELEVGASVLTASGGVAVPVDLLVKKPFTLAPWAEFTVGLGPEVVRVTGVKQGTYFGGEVSLNSPRSSSALRGRRPS